MCLHHEQVFLHRFEHLQVKCCDPFASHKGNVTKNLCVISLEKADMMVKKLGKRTVAGWKLCRRCVTAVDVELATTEDHQDINMSPEDEGTDDEVLSPEASTEALNESLGAIGVSPLKISKLNQAQRMSRGKRKLLQATSTLQNVMASSLSADPADFQQEQAKECQSCKELESLLDDLKRKCAVSTIQEKIQLLTLVPRNWTIEQTVSEFKGMYLYKFLDQWSFIRSQYRS